MTPRFEDIEVVAIAEDARLKSEYFIYDLPAGTRGTVVAVWGNGEAYEVEFAEIPDTFTFMDKDLMKVMDD